MEKVGDYALPRNLVYVIAVFLGIIAGVVNSFLAIDLRVRPMLGVLVLASLVLVIILHEGLHVTAAMMLGHKPQFGIKLPLVYITFTHKVPRNHFILIALTPFILLDIVFIVLYARGVLKLFCDLCLVINTIGAVGDIWIALKLLQMPRQSLILDTKTGFEVWSD